MDHSNKFSKVAYTLSAGLLASSLAFCGIQTTAKADALTDKEVTLKQLEILEDKVEEIAEQSDEIEDLAENEEFLAIRKLLVEALTLAIGEDFKQTIDVNETSLETLENLFELVTHLLDEENPVAIDLAQLNDENAADETQETADVDPQDEKEQAVAEEVAHLQDELKVIDAKKETGAAHETIEEEKVEVTPEASEEDEVEEVKEEATAEEQETISEEENHEDEKVDSNDETAEVAETEAESFEDNDTESKESKKVEEKDDQEESVENTETDDTAKDVVETQDKSEELEKSSKDEKSAPEKAKVKKAADTQTYTVSTRAKSSNYSAYIVKPGDTLNAISRKVGVSVAEIAKINHIQNINRIFVGQTLYLKASASHDTVEQPIQITTREEFIATVGEHARQVAHDNGLYASVMVAQAALESGFGQSTLSQAPNHNLFGIKGEHNGQSVVMNTTEWSSERGWYQVQAAFRKYPSYAESLQDNADVLRGGPNWAPDYYKGAWRENAKSYLEATQWLQGRYATDPTYASKLNNLIDLYNLTRFDSLATVEEKPTEQPSKPAPAPVEKPEVKPNTGSQNKPTPKPAPSTPATSQTYTVQAGDTLSGIARKYDTTVSALVKANHIKNANLISVGQKLVVGTKTVAKPTPQPEPKPAPSTPATGQTYIVQAGDTLSGIARKYGTTVSALVKANHIKNANLISVGQKLVVSHQAVTQPTPAPKPAPSTPATGQTYIVQAGDTLSGIARKYGTTVSALVKANHIKNANLISVGQKLVVGHQAVTQPTPAPKPSVSTGSTTGSTYIVQSGDNLSKIAGKYGISVAALTRANQIQNADLIIVGQKLTIPGATATQSSTSSQTLTTVKKQTYIVKAGDTLSGIARRQGVSVADLIRWNNIRNANLINIGQKITIGQRKITTTTQPAAQPVSSSAKTYTVVTGDTLWGIAKKFGTTVANLQQKNGLKSSLIIVGQQLKI